MFSNPTAITFVGYLLVMVCVGFYAYYHTRSYGDYILGGRSLGGFVTALSVGASDMSGWLLMGLPGAVYLAGISQSWIGIGLVLGSYINWCVVASRLRVYTEKTHNALTLPDYFSHRFEDKQNLLRIIAAVVILLFFTIYCASGVVAGARLFENTFSMSYETALILGAAATICYVFVGGFLAVSWTDTIQALLMCLALIVTPIAVMYDLGGFTAATECVASVDIKMLNILEGHTLVGIVSLLAWGLGYFGQPHILVRFMATRSIKVIPNARRVATLWMSFCLLGAVAVGFFVEDKTPYNNNVPAPKENPFKSALTVMKLPAVWMMVVLIFCGYGMYIGITYMTPYTTNVLGASIAFGAVLGTIRAFGLRVLTGPFSGYISDKMGSAAKILAICFVVIIGMLFVILSLPKGTSNAVIILLTMMFSFFGLVIYTTMFACMEEVSIPPQYTGIAVSVISLLGYLPDGLFPPLFGHWLDVYGNQGYSVIFYFLAGISLLGCCVAIVIYRKGRALRSGQLEVEAGNEAQVTA